MSLNLKRPKIRSIGECERGFVDCDKVIFIAFFNLLNMLNLDLKKIKLIQFKCNYKIIWTLIYFLNFDL